MKQLKDGDIDEIIAKINTRLRKELNFQLQLRGISITCCKFTLTCLLNLWTIDKS